MKLSRRQLRDLILEEIGPDKMEKPDSNMDSYEKEIAELESEFDLFFLANVIQKGRQTGVDMPDAYHVGDLSSGRLYLDYGGGPFVEVIIKPVGRNRDQIKKEMGDQPVEGKVGIY